MNVPEHHDNSRICQSQETVVLISYLHVHNDCNDSPIPKLLTQSNCSVVKLTDRKIRWIIREKSTDVLSTAEVARLQHVMCKKATKTFYHGWGADEGHYQEDNDESNNGGDSRDEE